MLKAETLAAYRAGLDRISDGAAQYVERMLREAAARHPDMTVAEWRDFAAAVMQAAAETYGEAGASLACELYDARIRASGYDKATTGIVLDPARAMATARYQAGKLVDGDLDGFIRECSAFCSDYVREATNSTMTGNWKRSRRSASRSRSAAAKAGNAHGVRFARVPQGGDTCTFCAMLASRGFVYWSRETAGEFDHYHRNCRCLVVPDDGSGEVEGYDPDEWLQRWRDYEEIDADAEHSDKVKRAAKRLISNNAAVSAEGALATASNLGGRVPPTSADVPSWTSGRKFSGHARKHAAALGLDFTAEEGREAYDRLFSDTMDSWDAIAYDDDFGGQRPDECVFYFKGDTIAIVNVATGKRVSLFKHESGISEHIDDIWDKAHSRP